MNVEVTILKPIPKNQIKQLEKRVVYNAAVFTREFTKNANAFPYLTGELQRTEIAAPIAGEGMEYGLTAGVGYATRVYKYTNAEWTNPATQPQWYFSVFKKEGKTIINQAFNTAIKEVGK